MIAALLCASLVAQIQGAPRVTVEQRALVGNLAFPQIGEQFGERIETGPDVGDDVVFIALRSATFDEFRDKVANALNVSWTQIDDKWRVHRTDDQRQADYEEMIRRRNEGIAKELAGMAAVKPLTLTQLDALDQKARIGEYGDAYVFSHPEDVDVGDRFMGRLVSSMSVSNLCSVPPGTRRTWALGDGRFQAPPHLEAVVAEYEQEWAQVDAVLREHRFYARAMEGPESPSLDTLYKWLIGGGPVLDKVYVSVTGHFDDVLLDVVAFDQDGRQVLTDYTYLGDLETTGRPPKLCEGMEPAARDERVAHLLKVIAGDDSAAIIDAATDLVADLPEHEPWGMDASSILLSYSRQMESDVIVQFDDTELMNQLGIYGLEDDEDGAAPIPLQAGMAWIAGFVQLREQDGVLIGRPIVAEPFRTSIDRKAVGGYVRSARGTRSVNLDRLGDVLKGVSDLEDDDWVFLPLVAHWDIGISTVDEVNLLPLYGSLSPSQRMAARSPSGFRSRLSTFGPGLTNELREAFLDVSNWSSFIQAAGDSPPEFVSVPGSAVPAQQRDVRPHVSGLTLTFNFDRLASRAEAELRVTTTTEVLGAKWSDGVLDDITIEQLARLYVYTTKASPERGQEFLTRYEFLIASKAKLEANVYFGGRKINLDPCEILLGFASPQGVKFDRLPESVKAEFWNIVRAARQDGG